VTAGVVSATINILANRLCQSLIVEQAVVAAIASVLNTWGRDINANIASDLGITAVGFTAIRIDT